MPPGRGCGAAFLRMKLTDPHGMKPTSVASWLPYTALLASSEWDGRKAETFQLKLQDPSGFRAALRGLRGASCSVQVSFLLLPADHQESIPESFIYSIDHHSLVTNWYTPLICMVHCCGLNYVPLKVTCWSPSVTVFGNRAWKKVIKVQCGHKGEALTHRTNVVK